MDRIDSYIHEAFAKFRDVPEIQAQKEEMADHLRDRIRDAIAEGKSEREAFDSVTGAVGDSMPDLEQTLAEFLRPEFRNGERPKPKTKEIYINFYRYHRAIMLLFAQILFTLMIFVMCEFASFGKHIKINLLGLAKWGNLGMGLFIVYSIAAYVWNPYRVKRVSASVWRLLRKYVFGGLVVLIGVLLFSLFCRMEGSDFDSLLGCLFCFLLFYTVFFVILSTLGWFRQSRYMFAPDAKQDTPLAKWGLLLTTVFFVALIIPTLLTLENYSWNIERQKMMTMQQQPTMPNADVHQQLEHMQNRLKAGMGDGIELPRDGYLMPIHDDNPHPMDGMNVMSAQGLTPANQQMPQLRLKIGQATNLMDGNYQMIWQVPGTRQDYQIHDSRRMFSNDSPMDAMMSGGMEMGFGTPPEPRLHELSLDGDFPATDLADATICARNFPFEDYKLGMIQAVAPETIMAGEKFSMRIGLGNLDEKNAKLLLTVEYDEWLEQEHIPSGSTLFLGFLAAHEYREYTLEMHVKNDGRHKIRLQLRNESGQVIAETTVVINGQFKDFPRGIVAPNLESVLRDMLRECNENENIDDMLPQFSATIPGIFDWSSELAESFSDKTYDRETTLNEIRKHKEVFDEMGVVLPGLTTFFMEKAVNMPEELSDEKLEMTRRLTNRSVKQIEEYLPNAVSDYSDGEKK